MWYSNDTRQKETKKKKNKNKNKEKKEMQSESPNIMEDRKGTRECNDKNGQMGIIKQINNKKEEKMFVQGWEYTHDQQISSILAMEQFRANSNVDEINNKALQGE